MIGKIEGNLSEIHGNEALVRTSSGVSYRVYIGHELMLKKGSEVSIYTHLDVKEDSLKLFGFQAYEEYMIFMLLTGVDGVGPKIAFNIVQTAKYIEIIKAIELKDVSFFQRIKGIGKKTAQKILIDLSTKIGSEVELSDIIETQDDRDAFDALISLGFSKEAVSKALQSIDSSLSIEDKIKLALQKL